MSGRLPRRDMARVRPGRPGRPGRAVFWAVLLGAWGVSQAGCAGRSAGVMDPVVRRAMETSLYADRVDWPAVDAEYKRLVADGGSAEALRPGLAYLISAMGDEHGAVRSAADGLPIAWYTGERGADALPWDDGFVRAVLHDTSAEFSYALLAGGVGYLRVVGIGPGDVDAQAAQIREGLLALKAEGVERWVVDLRFNGGGNMNPMLAGLGPLVGEGFVGGAVDAEGEWVRRYAVVGGVFFDSGRRVSELEPGPAIGAGEKVAVLLSRYTMSSGELVAIAFKGRAGTRFFGERSAGYTTGTGYEDIGHGLVMTISESVMADRDGNTYPHGLSVDVESTFRPERGGGQDAQLNAALEWFAD